MSKISLFNKNKNNFGFVLETLICGKESVFNFAFNEKKGLKLSLKKENESEKKPILYKGKKIKEFFNESFSGGFESFVVALQNTPETALAFLEKQKSSLEISALFEFLV